MSEANSPQPPTYYSLKRKRKNISTAYLSTGSYRLCQCFKSVKRTGLKKGLLQLQGGTHFKIIHDYLIIKQVFKVKLRQKVNKAHHSI